MTTVESNVALHVRKNLLVSSLKRLLPGLAGHERVFLVGLARRGVLRFPEEELLMPPGVARERLNSYKLPRDAEELRMACAVNLRRAQLFVAWLQHGLFPVQWGENEFKRLALALGSQVTYVRFLVAPHDLVGTLIVERD